MARYEEITSEFHDIFILYILQTFLTMKEEIGLRREFFFFFLINISFKTPCIWLNFPLIVKGIYDPAVPDLSSSIIIEKSSSYIVTTNDIIYDT